jgi:ADP-ribose pyrophosphatase YjhB (NUDIX family)
VPSVTVGVRDEHGRILLVHKIDNDLWALPGGGHDAGESIAETAVREVLEETGVQVEVTGIVGLYTNPNHVMKYDDGEVRQQFSICFSARLIGGSAREDGTETKEVKWVDVSELDQLNIHPSMRLRIDHYLEDRPRPFIG